MDAETGPVHSLAGISANVHDITQAESLLHEHETDVFADAGYRGIEKRTGEKRNWHIAMRPGKRRVLMQLKSDRIRERIEQLKASEPRSSTRSESPSASSTLPKVRYRGLAKKNRSVAYAVCYL